jgi:hypothetical protein
MQRLAEDARGSRGCRAALLWKPPAANRTKNTAQSFAVIREQERDVSSFEWLM